MPNTTTFEFGKDDIYLNPDGYNMRYVEGIGIMVEGVENQHILKFDHEEGFAKSLESFYRAKDEARYQPLSMASALEVGYRFKPKKLYSFQQKMAPITQYGSYFKRDNTFLEEDGQPVRLVICDYFFPCLPNGLLDRQAHDEATALGVTLWKEGE